MSNWKEKLYNPSLYVYHPVNYDLYYMWYLKYTYYLNMHFEHRINELLSQILDEIYEFVIVNIILFRQLVFFSDSCGIFESSYTN